MTTFRFEDLLVGLIAAGLIPWIGWTLARGLREGRLPIGRAYVARAERPAAFRVLFVLWIAAAAMAAFIGLDLLFNLDVSF